MTPPQPLMLLACAHLVHMRSRRSHCPFSVYREGNDPALVDDDIIFEDFARLRLKGAETEEADA